MQNKNYELVKRTRKRIQKILKTSTDKYELLEMKNRLRRRNKRLWRYRYQVRPQVIQLTIKN